MTGAAANIGAVGLSGMGSNLARNLASRPGSCRRSRIPRWKPKTPTDEMTSTVAVSAPHGSPAGRVRRCLTPAMCPNHRSDEVLTLGRLPLDQPLPRAVTVPAAMMTPAVEGTQPVHGRVESARRRLRPDLGGERWMTTIR